MIRIPLRYAASLYWLVISAFLGSLTVPAVAEAQGGTASLRNAPTGKLRNSAWRSNPAWAPNPGVESKDAYLIVDAMSGRELASDHPDELRHPASLTKLMTIYLALSALDSGRLNLGDTLSVSASALNAPPTKMGLMYGPVTVRDAIMGLVTRSANDAAILLAETLGGDEESFARLMTQKAHQLGMRSTVFRNASGLPDREQVTTARDMSKLAHALLRDFPHYYPVFSVQYYQYRSRMLENHNRMLASYPGADGLKTGYTIASGFNLVMSAMRDNRRLIGVVMGGNTAFTRDRLMAELMDSGFATADSLKLPRWTSPRQPPSARYTAANFVPSGAPPETMLAAKQPPAGNAPRLATAVAPSVGPPQGDASPPMMGWVIQIGSFGDQRAALSALERATSALPESIRSHSAVTVDEVQMAQKIFHRARLTNLTQDEAMIGCRQLERRKIYCSALQVTAWDAAGR